MQIDILDDSDCDLKLHYKESIEFIEKSIQGNGKVLVHC